MALEHMVQEDHISRGQNLKKATSTTEFAVTTQVGI